MSQRSFTRIILAALFALSLTWAGCLPEDPPPPDISSPDSVGDTGGDTGSDTAADTTTPPVDWLSCSAPSDCALVELECCDHCNGGTLLSVNVSHVAAVEADYTDKDCEGAQCTLMGCSTKKATCEAGVCGYTDDTPLVCATLDPEACKAAASCGQLRGAPVAEVCGGNYDHWMSVPAGCMGAEVGCGAAETCARADDGSAALVFPSTCIPAGWEVLSWEACCDFTEPPGEWLTCAADSQCVALELGCCDHCNGGSLLAVNTTYEEAATKAFKDTDCAGIFCTEMACGPVFTACESGVCAVSETQPCSVKLEADCIAFPDCMPILGTASTAVCGGDSSDWASTFLGCMDANLGCGDMPTCGVDPSGDKWMFADTCIPQGWTTAEQCCEDAPTCRAVNDPGNTWGDCEMVMGVAFDGTACVSVSGCGCDPETDVACAALFANMNDCNASCIDQQPPRWFLTCGDPVCGNYTPPPGVALCSGQVLSAPCYDVGSTCDPKSNCNALMVCAWSDPTQQPGGCPISVKAAKKDVRYASETDVKVLYSQLLATPLATFRYRAAPDGARPQLGFIIEDMGISPAVYPERGKVDLYGYTSMAVGAIQAQAKEIAALRAELKQLREGLARACPTP